MSGNTIGRIFQLHSFGESHAKAIGGVIDGFPAGFEINMDAVKVDIERRRTNQGIFSSTRNEADDVQVLSLLHPFRFRLYHRGGDPPLPPLQPGQHAAAQ